MLNQLHCPSVAGGVWDVASPSSACVPREKFTTSVLSAKDGLPFSLVFFLAYFHIPIPLPKFIYDKTPKVHRGGRAWPCQLIGGYLFSKVKSLLFSKNATEIQVIESEWNIFHKSLTELWALSDRSIDKSQKIGGKKKGFKRLNVPSLNLT